MMLMTISLNEQVAKLPVRVLTLISSGLRPRVRLAVGRRITFLFVSLMLTASAWAGRAPAAPANLSAAAVSSSQINLTWQDASSNESGFKIERAPTAGGAWVQIATVGANVTTYANANLTASTTYYYRVRSYNSRN